MSIYFIHILIGEATSEHHSFLDTLTIPGVFLLFLNLTVMKAGCMGSWTVIGPVLISQVTNGLLVHINPMTASLA